MHERLFRALLRLLPAEFRSGYGADMEAAFRDERRARGGGGLVALWLATLLDMLRLAPAEQWDVFQRDARVGLRALRARPVVSLLAVATLGLGIGLNVAMFAVLDAVLLAPLPYADAGRLVVVQEGGAGSLPGNLGYATFVDLRDRVQAFSSLAAATQSYATLAGDGRDAERASAMRVSASYFDLIGVRPALGRAFGASEDRPGEARRVAVLSDRLWRRRFGGDPGVIGRLIDVSGAPVTVLGVMPAGFEDLVARRLFDDAELWTPLGYDPSASFACRTCRHLRAFGRLRPGLSEDQAQRDVAAALTQLAREHPADYDAPSARVTTLDDFFLGPVRPALAALSAGVALLLLAACANVANLLLLRASERGHELAVRTALGVTRGRLARQLLTESALLAAAGGVAGLLPAWALLEAIAATGPAQLPRLASVALDGRAVAAAAGFSALSCMIFGLVPLRHLASQDLGKRLHGASRHTPESRAWTLRASLVASNVAMAVVLLVGAGLLLRSVTGLLAVPTGFDSARVLTLRVDVSGPRYADDEPAVEIGRVSRFYEGVLGELRRLPGVVGASGVSTLPLGGGHDSMTLHRADRPAARPEEDPEADRFAVLPGFFETLRIPVLRGRGFDAGDAQAAPRVAVLNAGAAADLFPGEDPVGREIRLGPPDAEARRIVGVVADTRHRGLDSASGYQVYVPAAQWAWAESTMTLLVRTSGAPGAMAPAVRTVLRETDPAQPVTRVRPYGEIVGASLGLRSFATSLLGAFAASALLLALGGLYGALGVLVRQRRREIGIRMALGAASREIRRMVLRQAFGPVAAGLACGLLAAGAAGRLLSSLLYGVPPHDPATFAAVSALLAASAAGAALVPAWRATRTDAAITLRAE